MDVRDFGGLDNQNAPADFGLKRLTVADNIDITRSGKIASRKGRKRLTSTNIDAACHVGNVILYQSGANLHVLSGVGDDVVVQNNLNAANWLCAATDGTSIVWSNGIDTGVIHGAANATLGIPAPDVPVASQIFGTMPSGRYLYTVTWTRSDGLESGAKLSGQIDVTSGGIMIANAPAYPGEGYAINLYLSSANGEVLYFAGSFPEGYPIRYTNNTIDLQVQLETQFCDIPPAFSSVCIYKGRAYYMHGNVVWASRPYSYGLVDYSADFFALSGDGLLMVDVADGMFVADANATYFLAGNDAQDFVMREVLPYGAIHGTAVRGGDNNKPHGKVTWASSRGAIAGFDGGSVKNLTEGVFHYGSSNTGCGVLRHDNGQSHFVVSLLDEQVPYNARRISILAHIESPIPAVIVAMPTGELLGGDMIAPVLEILANGG